MDFSQFFQNLKASLGDEFFDALENVDEDAVAPIALILGVDKNNLCALIRIIPRLIKGEITLKSLLPHLLPVLLSYFLLPQGAEADEAEDDKKTEKADFKNLNEDSLEKEKDGKSSLSEGLVPYFAQKNAATEKLCSVADDDIFYSLNAYMQS